MIFTLPGTQRNNYPLTSFFLSFIMRIRAKLMTPRPHKKKFCSPHLRDYFFKPRGIAVSKSKTAILSGDELEAMRLCDFVDLDHEDAAKKVGISRRTLERMLNRGRQKVVGALLQGTAISINFPDYITFRPTPSQGRIKKRR
jgi:uncharacterized protein